MNSLAFLKSNNLKFTKRLDLSEFNAALEGNFLEVWLNLDEQWWGDWAQMSAMSDANQAWIATERARIEALPEAGREDAYGALIKQIDFRADELNALAFGIRARLWGCTPEDAEGIFEASVPLYNWITERAIDLVIEYRTGRKKVPSAT